ncbi:head decoration protein [uncultured Hyphomicrobium sp.]|uniref:head decoration protein n=1 Tax=uncultured Hyphomicrobium sp. TaxID=194373 RepID=UPI0025D70108|nr:head decoration protein [uncultured Hyphomicrobium sp.]
MTNLAHPAFGGTVSALVRNELALPGKDPVLAPFKIAQGLTLKRGSVLGRVSASGALILSLAAAGDGSNTPFAVLLEDVDTTLESGPTVRTVAVEGFFNETALVFGTGHTADTVRAPLRDRGIYLSAPRYSFA